MLCSFCKKEEAVIHIHEYAGDSTRKINLCLKCAIQRGLNIGSVEELDDIFSNLVANIFSSEKKNRKQTKVKKEKEYRVSMVCPACNNSAQTLVDDMRVGCPVCYSIYEKIIDYYIFRKNKSLTYLGNLPDDLTNMRDDRTELDRLKKELSNHIKKEEFDKAALVRDEIKEIKMRLQKRIQKIANR